MRINPFLSLALLSATIATPALADDAMKPTGAMTKMSDADMKKMKACQMMSHDDMMKNAGCVKLMKKHPDMMPDHGAMSPNN